MKKIMIIHTNLGYGGAEKMLAFVVNTLAKNYLVKLVLLQKKPITLNLSDKVLVEELDVYEDKPIIGKHIFSGLVKFVEILKSIKIIAKRFAPNLTLCFDLRIFVAAYIALKFNKTKFLFSERADPYFNSIKWQLLLKYMYKNIDGLVFQTKEAKEFYGKKLPKNVFIIHNPAIPRSDGVADRKKYNYKYIFSAGHLIYRKGFDVLIKAFVFVRKKFPEYHLVIYGNGVEKDKLEALVTRLGISDYVHFYNPINNVIEQNINSELFVMPSRSEGIPNILIEAMQAGMTSVATDCSPGGANLISDNGKYCLLAKNGDVNDLTEKIIFALENKDYMRKMSLKAKNSLIRFDRTIIEKEWLEAVYKVLC